MSDIVARIRKVETTPLRDTESWVDLWEVLQDARAEIVSLREAIRRFADQDATLSVVGGNVIVDIDATPEVLEQLSQRGGPLVPFDPPTLTLTDAEREAIAWVCFGKDGKEYATLRGLLERMK